MALIYTKQIPSGSTSGKNVEVNNTSSPGTTFHTVQATATAAREEVYLYAINAGTATAFLTVEWGGTGTADQIPVNVPGQDGPYLIIPGFTLTATSSIVRAFATATGIFRLVGYVNRAT